MSDMHKLRQKVTEGIEWEGTVTVELDDDEIELTVRQLRDGEFFKVLSMIDRDELRSLQDQVPTEIRDEYRELQEQDELDESERERLEELQRELRDEMGVIFDEISEDTFEGIRQAGKYAVVPDDEDLRRAFTERAREIEQEYGIDVKQPEDVRDVLERELEDYIDNATNFLSFIIGLSALERSIGGGDAGN